MTVESSINDGCSTAILMPLSLQIADEMVCMAPGVLTTISEGNGIAFSGSAVLPYVTPQAKADLLAAVAARGGTLQINSGFRTVAQQYLLYRWYQAGLCGITAAATPGRSNHESARALDVGNYTDWKSTLQAHNWSQSVPGDPVHFDHLGSPDYRGMDVHAFQRLWNRNNPGDLIDEDGLYGPATGARLAQSPIEGFAIGPCPTPDTDPDPVDPMDPIDPTDPLFEQPGDLTDHHDTEPDRNLIGGCNTSGGGAPGGLALSLLALGFILSRRRAR
ncbi:MAG TPA: M15 family metallopeptidase [Kofleriaceae bacterium]|nr:M15 family metallopeptidase [Kofleriaceae bacterium]